MAGSRVSFYSDDCPNIARRVMLLGASRAELAEILEVSERVMATWEEKYPDFREALKAGGMNASSRVAEALYKRATGYRYTETQAVKTKEGVEVVTVEKEVLPDVTAIKLWLFNRDPERWKDRNVLTDTEGNELLKGVKVMFVQAPQKMIEGTAREVGNAD